MEEENTEQETQNTDANANTSDIAGLPFPHARVKDILKSKLTKGTYIKKKAVINLNLWLGNLADKISEELSKTEKAYVDADDVTRVISKFDAVDQIEKEKKRISAHLNALKEDINRLLDDLERV
ncbi:MAG: hypothetical protein KAU95_01815 [Candidatus Aenigmarchaeota archaeon]|nr:hypothetical protein [Candidatus Aenigmarchaeota archaeon]